MHDLYVKVSEAPGKRTFLIGVTADRYKSMERQLSEKCKKKDTEIRGA